MDELSKKVEEEITSITSDGLNPSNTDYLYKLVDIHKDLANEDYWKIKEEKYNAEIRKLWKLW